MYNSVASAKISMHLGKYLDDWVEDDLWDELQSYHEYSEYTAMIIREELYK